MAADSRDLVERGLELKKAGNELITAIGGRPIHPVNVRVGGFYRVPSRRELAPAAERLRRARDHALATVAWVAGFDFPDVEHDYRFLALRHPGEYGILSGTVVTGDGHGPVSGFEVARWPDHVTEEQVPHSTALHARLDGETGYLTGPLARYALNSARLSPLAREAAAAAGLGPVCRNPYRGIVVRAVEIVHACDEALRLLGGYAEPERPCVPVEPRPGVGHGASEAPRGTLYHRYRLDEGGLVAEADIVPPPRRTRRASRRTCATCWRRASPCRRTNWPSCARRVARLLRGTLPPSVAVVESSGDPAALVEVWSGAALAIVVDAVSSGAPPGTVHRPVRSLPRAAWRCAGSHSLGLADAVELGLALGRLPGELVVAGIEGGDFTPGAPMTRPVLAAARRTADELRERLSRERPGGPRT
ncbi:hydrogenase maturation protease [Microbispora sp. NPDC046933]|uniref:hydrogenase maturation protease n=1 Tax=Microbispora sp. NPDC046933 TaxID=3155618 RepID=UPI0033D8A576